MRCTSSARLRSLLARLLRLAFVNLKPRSQRRPRTSRARIWRILSRMTPASSKRRRLLLDLSKSSISRLVFLNHCFVLACSARNSCLYWGLLASNCWCARVPSLFAFGVRWRCGVLLLGLGLLKSSLGPRCQPGLIISRARSARAEVVLGRPLIGRR